jgi:hypothetical protein
MKSEDVTPVTLLLLGMCLPKDFMPSDFEALENQCFYLHSAAI